MKTLMFRLFALITLLVTIAFASAVASVSADTPDRNISASEKTMDHVMEKNREEAATITIISAIY